MTSYKDLNIDRELIEKVIDDNLEDSKVSIKRKKGIISYIFDFVGSAETAILHVYLNTNGTTTLMHSQGKRTDFSKKIADKIIENCLIKELKFNQLFFKSISTKQFSFLLEYIADIKAVIGEPITHPTGIQYKVKGKYGECLSITKYNNNSIHFQGKPSLLFNQVVDVLVEIFPSSDVLTQVLGYYEIKTPESDIISEFSNLCPVTSAQISDNLKSVIVPSVALRKISLELSDYSYMTYPVLRGLEGAMKHFFLEHGIVVKSDGFGEYFKKNPATLKYDPTGTTIKCISCEKTREALCKMYAHLHQHRHSLFHADSITPIRINQQQAFELIDSTLNIIESSFVSVYR